MYHIMNVYKHRAQRASVSWSKQHVLWRPAVTTWADLTQAPVHQWRLATSAPPTVTPPWTQFAAMPTWLTVCIILYFPCLLKPEFFAQKLEKYFPNTFVVYREPLHPEAALLSVFEIQQSIILGEIRNHARRNLWRFWPNQDRFCEFGTLLPMRSLRFGTSRSLTSPFSFVGWLQSVCVPPGIRGCGGWIYKLHHLPSHWFPHQLRLRVCIGRTHLLLWVLLLQARCSDEQRYENKQRD